MSNVSKSFSVFLSGKGLPDNIISYTIPVDMTLHADKDLLNRLLTNVLRNAVEAVAAVESPRIEVKVSVSEGHPYISVEDNGCGVPPEVMRNLFQPFFTTKPDGSGIGLCLSRQIARLHGGDFTLTSVPNHGCGFAIMKRFVIFAVLTDYCINERIIFKAEKNTAK